jgi:hypothetical protein
MAHRHNREHSADDPPRDAFHLAAAPVWLAPSEHLRSLSAGREYLASRCGPELAAMMAQINRLLATIWPRPLPDRDAPTSNSSVVAGHR